jgi:hypothetical protein
VGPQLRTLLVGDDPGGWTAAGFAVDGDEVRIGEVRIRLTGTAGPRGLHGWELAGVGAGPIDGVPTTATDAGPATPADHANRATRIDHVVARTPDLARTTAALAAAGLAERRRRPVPGSEPATVQVFFWVGQPILELVGPVVADGDGPTRLWGLALTCDDLDAAADALGDRLGPVSDAVQSGRRIATVRTRPLGVSTPLALMSPHVP